MTPKLGVAILVYKLVYSKVRHRLEWIRTFIQGWIKMAQIIKLYKMDYHVVRINVLNVKDRYFSSDKYGKGEILKSLEDYTKRDRKHLIKVLNESKNGWSNVSQSKVGRPLSYDKEELLPHIRRLWLNMERISPGRMKAGFKDWLPFDEECPSPLKLQLQKMSPTTLGRYMSEIRSTLECSKGITSTSPARFMKNKVPINTLDSKITKPGYTQTDTVAHCGNAILGSYAHSLTVTDIFSAWTANRALFTKKGEFVKRAFQDIERGLPFSLLAINSDSGSEFLNKPMLEFTKHGTRIVFTRSRPYKKNDNCFVEQKNFTHVRELFGYERFEDPDLVDLMNEIYINYWNPLQNFFIPNYKLKEKIRVGSRVVKKYDTPQTPYSRLINFGNLTAKEIEVLREQKAKLNPFVLKRGLETKLKEFFEQVRKTKNGNEEREEKQKRAA